MEYMCEFMWGKNNVGKQKPEIESPQSVKVLWIDVASTLDTLWPPRYFLPIKLGRGERL